MPPIDVVYGLRREIPVPTQDGEAQQTLDDTRNIDTTTCVLSLVSRSRFWEPPAMQRTRNTLVALTLVFAASQKLSAQDAGSQIIVSTVPSGLQVRVDGEARGVSPVRIGELLPGTHLVEAILPSGETVTRIVELGANSSQVVQLSAETVPPAPSNSPAAGQLTPPPPQPSVAPVPPVRAPAPEPESGVRLRLESDPVGLRLNFHAGSTLHQTGNYMLAINSWNPVCTAPCEQRIEPGHYRAAVSDLDGDYYAVRGGLDLTRDRDMQLSINYRRGPRVAGWLMAIVGYGMMFGSLAFIGNDDPTLLLTFLSVGAVVGLVGQTMALLIKPVGVVEY